MSSTATPHRRSSRIASRAGSAEPSEAGSDHASDTASVRQRKRNARNRNTLSNNGNESYGTRAALAGSAQVGYNTTQSAASSALGNTLEQPESTPGFGRPYGLSNVPEEDSDDSMVQPAVNDQTQVTQPAQPDVSLAGDAGGVGNWLRGIVNPRPRVLTTLEITGLRPDQHVNVMDPNDPSFGQPLAPSMTNTNTEDQDEPLPAFARFKRWVWNMIVWFLTLGIQGFYYIAFTFFIFAMAELLFGPLLGEDHDLLFNRVTRLKPENCVYQCLETKQIAHPLGEKVDDLVKRFKWLPQGPGRDLHPQVDYFSPANGAQVVTKLTSPEKMRPVTGWKSLFISEKPLHQVEKIRGPFADVKKQWCAPSKHGKAQVTVSLAANMAPQEIYITQSPHQGAALDASTYPKELELWVEVLDPQVRKELLDKFEQRFGFDRKIDNVSQYKRKLDSEQALPETFVPIDRWDHEISDNPWWTLQSQQRVIDTDISDYNNTSTRRVAVRVNSNWGDTDETCIHEIKLHGKFMDKMKEYKIKDAKGYVEKKGIFKVHGPLR